MHRTHDYDIICIAGPWLNIWTIRNLNINNLSANWRQNRIYYVVQYVQIRCINVKLIEYHNYSSHYILSSCLSIWLSLYTNCYHFPLFSIVRFQFHFNIQGASLSVLYWMRLWRGLPRLFFPSTLPSIINFNNPLYRALCGAYPLIPSFSYTFPWQPSFWHILQYLVTTITHSLTLSI